MGRWEIRQDFFDNKDDALLAIKIYKALNMYYDSYRTYFVFHNLKNYRWVVQYKVFVEVY